MAPMYDVIVIGMGAAGVTALTTLAKAGKSVLGLEAAGYVGGRVKTVEFGKGVVELGAEWIHGERPSKVFELAAEHRVPIVQQSLELDVFGSDGSVYDRSLMNELVVYCLGISEHPPVVPEPLGQYVTAKFREYVSDRPELANDEDFMTGFLDLMNLMVNNYESSDDWNDVTTSSNYTELEGYQHWSWHTNGYRTFFDILLNRHNGGPRPAEVKLDTEVVGVAWREPAGAVRVRAAGGAQYRARAAILTLSLGVLKERHSTMFTPQLPAEKVEAINAMAMGVMGKIILSFDQEWWPTDVTFFAFQWRAAERARVPPADAWTARIFGASRPLGARGCLTLWTCGEAGKLVETLPDDVVKRKVMELLRMFMGKKYNVTEPTGIIRSDWYKNPLTRGSFSYDSVTAARLPGARAALATPLRDAAGVPRVLFAGEATNEYHFSTVHGACETGAREAARLLEQDGARLVKSKI